MTLQGALEEVADHLLALDLPELRLLPDGDLLTVTALGGLIGRLAGALNVMVAGEIANRSRPSLGFDGLAARHGKRKPTGLIEEIARVSNAEAVHRVRLAGVVQTGLEVSGWERPPRFPVLADALTAGEIDGDAAAIIVRCLDACDRTAPTGVQVAEHVLVEFATREPADRVGVLARTMRDRLDPDGVRPRAEETHTRRGIRLGREHHGIVPLNGGIDPEFAALLKAEFDAANSPNATPRFVPITRDAGAGGIHPDLQPAPNPDEHAGVNGDDHPGRDHNANQGETTGANNNARPGFTFDTDTVQLKDTRTREQRQHDVLFGIVKAGIRTTGNEPGALRSTADVTITIALSDLRDGTGPGYLTGIDEPVSAQTVERLLCDATWRKAILGANGEPLALGKTQYRFSTGQKRAILLRDGDTCVMCDTPATWGDFHHVIPYNADGSHGRTDVSNGVNLCPRDHSLFHNSSWKIRIRNGTPEVQPPPDIDWTRTWRPVGKNRTRANYPHTG